MAPDLTANPQARSCTDLRQHVEKIRWYHSIDLGDGIVTPGVDPSPQKLRRLHLPEDLSGKTVLDVGAWDGFFSFEAERRGAERVLATDSYAWSGVDWGSKRGFELARTRLGSTVEDMDVDVLDLSPQGVGVFDVTLFLGVLYHLRHPMLALEKVAAVTRELLILETAVDPDQLVRTEPRRGRGDAAIGRVSAREHRLPRLHCPPRRPRDQVAAQRSRAGTGRGPAAGAGGSSRLAMMRARGPAAQPIPPLRSPPNFSRSLRSAGSSGRTTSDSSSALAARSDRLIRRVLGSTSSTLTVTISLGLTIELTLFTRSLES
jgi:SAM-dependent methyltransferase